MNRYVVMFVFSLILVLPVLFLFGCKKKAPEKIACVQTQYNNGDRFVMLCFHNGGKVSWRWANVKVQEEKNGNK